MKQFIYILTDSNRQTFKIGLTDDLGYTIQYYKNRKAMAFDSHRQATRLVYFEEVLQENALIRLKEIDTYTRPQKERLIRFDNTDWVDLSIQMDMQILSTSYGKLNYAS